MTELALVGYKDETVRYAGASSQQQLTRLLVNIARLDHRETAKLFFQDPTSRSEILEALVLTYGGHMDDEGVNTMVRDGEASHVYLQLRRRELQVGLLYQRIEPEAP